MAENLLLTIEKYSKKIDADISIFEAMLKKTGNFEALGAAPGTEVAIRTDMYAENDWILGRVLNFYQDTGYFDIADMDDSSKRHFLSELQVILLPFDVGDMKFAKGVPLSLSLLFFLFSLSPSFLFLFFFSLHLSPYIIIVLFHGSIFSLTFHFPFKFLA